LPPDAVDLVVEDPDAAQEDLANERRKGEPATKPHLRKVYRRGFVAHDEEGQRAEGEIEVDDGREVERHGPGRVEAGEQILEALGDEGEDAQKTHSPDDRFLAGETVVTTAETPPIHARVYLDNEENPWA
jgi:hypothetical protein